MTERVATGFKEEQSGLQQCGEERLDGVEMIDLKELNNDQRREKVNTEQRFEAWRESKRRATGYRGSLVWHEVKGEEYLTRSYYDSAGVRRQKVEGRRSPEMEKRKVDWEAGRAQAVARQKLMREILDRQSAVNRALRLGRVPLVGARIIRAIDDAELLGDGLRVVGTNAIYAYEAAAGVMVDAGITATQDIDLLMDARRELRVIAQGDVPDGALIGLLRKTDRSFERTRQSFRAVNREGYLVDLIKPQRNPPWRQERDRIGGGEDELVAAPINGLTWLESAPAFEAIAVDEKGTPVRIVAIDPRVFAAHKLWLSKQVDRDPTKRPRDRAQAEAVAQLVARYLTHLPFESSELRMIPRAVFDDAKPLFEFDGRDPVEYS